MQREGQAERQRDEGRQSTVGVGCIVRVRGEAWGHSKNREHDSLGVWDPDLRSADHAVLRLPFN